MGDRLLMDVNTKVRIYNFSRSSNFNTLEDWNIELALEQRGSKSEHSFTFNIY